MGCMTTKPAFVESNYERSFKITERPEEEEESKEDFREDGDTFLPATYNPPIKNTKVCSIAARI